MGCFALANGILIHPGSLSSAMILDAPSFTLNLTPEAALSVIQKEINRRNWRQWEVEEIRLEYVPYYIFSFDVEAEGSTQPTGNAALNANTGELDEFVPTLMTRPLSKTRKTDDKAQSPEVEPTNISAKDVERVAAVKIAASTGLKKESVVVSAVAKYYFPFYRVWINVGGEHGNSYTINVDALEGAPLGLEAVAPHKGGFEDEAQVTLNKLGTPAGWMDLIGSIPAAFTGGRGPIAEALASKTTRWIILIIVILILMLLAFRSPSASPNCTTDPAYTGPGPALGLSFLGPQQVLPARTAGGSLYLHGTCQYSNPSSNQVTVCTNVLLMVNGQQTQVINTSCAIAYTGGVPSSSEFSLTWQANQTPAGFGPGKYSLSYQTRTLG
jgi:hypothetical protein